MKKIFAILLAAVMCVTLFAACGDKQKKVEETSQKTSEINKELDKVIVATIDGVDITQAYYNLVYTQRFGEIYQQYGTLDWLEEKDESGKTAIEHLKESAETQIGQRTVARKMAEENGIKITDEMKNRAKEESAQVLANSGAEFLEAAHTTEAAILYFLEEQYMIDALVEKLSAEGGVAHLTEEKIAEAEKMFNADYADKLRVQHILISTMADQATGAPGKTEEEALKIANEVIAKLDAGEDFDSLIPDYNEDPGMSQGQYYTFGAGEMVAEFEEESRKLAVGEYSKAPVKTDYGYHIIKKYAIDTTIPEFENYKNYMIDQKVGELLLEKLEGTKKTWKNDVVDKFVDEFIKEQKKNFEESQNAAAN